MKKFTHFKALSFFLLVSFLLAACSGAAVPSTSTAGGGKPLAQMVAYAGVIENIADNQWTINGITVTVDPSVVRDGPFQVGDQVKVEATVHEDGSITVSRVEAASADDAAGLPSFGDDDLNGNTNDDNSNDALNTNDDNGNDDNSNDANSNDNGGASVNSNDSNSNDDNGGSSNSNDSSSGSNSNDSNSNDDDSNSNSNDDHGGGDDNNNDDDDKNENSGNGNG